MGPWARAEAAEAKGLCIPYLHGHGHLKNEIRREESSSREDSKSDPANLIARKGVISFYHHRLT
ncbi:hypothetical protein PVL29_022035 [Vitis rotundifolia]|uniref:Uncharacterized protein n=1 Tax=Vitis rotundifolia TaxID=103349 RepID=A0AA38YUC0_VITRO|nr:hypothetical protein PVL29_022035 [Vitis rotundifolia]